MVLEWHLNRGWYCESKIKGRRKKMEERRLAAGGRFLRRVTRLGLASGARALKIAAGDF